MSGNGAMTRFERLSRPFMRVQPEPTKAGPGPVELETAKFSEWAQDNVSRVHFVEWLDERVALLDEEANKSMSDLGALAGCTRARKELLYVRNKIREWARFANQGPSQGETNG